MGDPKKKQKLYTTPKVPFNSEMFAEDLKLLGAYGLRNKHELWRIRTQLSTYRRRAREILAMTGPDREVLEKNLIGKISGLGLIAPNGTLDDILTMSVEDFMERRLQTFVFRKGMVKSLWQSRQLITHGHISIGGLEVTSPGYHVKVADEQQVDYTGVSPYANKDHPLRQELSARELAQGGAKQ